MLSRVTSEILECKGVVVSSFQENCRPEYAAFPYTYCSKDESSHSCIDNFLVAGDIVTSSNSINHIFSMPLFSLNDHFPIMLFFSQFLHPL